MSKSKSSSIEQSGEGARPGGESGEVPRGDGATQGKSDEEVICEWMEPGREIPGNWMQYIGWGRGWRPCTLTLDRLHEVEARLTDEQWKPYIMKLLPWQSLNKLYVEQLFCLLHATAEQKIKALAAVIQSEMKA